MSWTVFPEEPERQAAVAMPAAITPSTLKTDKLLDAKVRLHRRLLEELNLAALEKLPENEMRQHVQQLVSQYVVNERLALNQQELNDFVAEIIDEMTGLGPLEPLLKDRIDQRYSDQRPRECLHRARRPARAGRLPLQGRSASSAHHQQDRFGGRTARR